MFRSITTILLCLATVAHGAPTAFPAGDTPAGDHITDKTPTVKSLDDCNVVWDKPSGDSFGSMPLGNGDVGLNVWVEDNGDLVFYISKVDAFDAKHLLPKLGRVRLRLEPALDVGGFRQSLILRDAAIEIKAGDVNLRVWVDANQPVVRVQGTSGIPRKAVLTVESLRPLAGCRQTSAENGTAALLFNDENDRIAWCYRNQSSDWAARFANQNSPEMVAKTKDPILHRTSGCVIAGKGFTRASPDSLDQHASDNGRLLDPHPHQPTG